MVRERVVVESNRRTCGGASFLSLGGAGAGAAGHGFSGFEEEGAFAIVHAGERFGKFAELVALVAVVAPLLNFLWRQEGNILWRRGTVVEEAIQRNFERAGVLLQSFDRRDGVAVFDTGGIAADESRARLDVTLAEVL